MSENASRWSLAVGFKVFGDFFWALANKLNPKKIVMAANATTALVIIYLTYQIEVFQQYGVKLVYICRAG